MHSVRSSRSLPLVALVRPIKLSSDEQMCQVVCPVLMDHGFQFGLKWTSGHAVMLMTSLDYLCLAMEHRHIRCVTELLSITHKKVHNTDQLKLRS